jgi:predicted transcriptional regulator
MLFGNYPSEISFSTGDKNGKNIAGDIDIKLFSIQKFMKMLIEGETVVNEPQDDYDHLVKYEGWVYENK